MKPALTMVAAVLALVACQKAPEVPKQEATAASTAPTPAAGEPVVAPGPTKAPAGAYEIDPTHTNLTFKLSHLGFSNYTAKFAKVEGKLNFDPANPAAMTVEATIDPASLELNAPPKGFHEEIIGKGWLDAGAFPAITFKSTKVEPTGANTANVTGDFTLHGVTKPIVLAVTFNGGWPPNAFDGARIGFSAKGALKRSDFGVGAGLPPPGTNFGVGDQISVAIETEFHSGKPTTPPPAKK
jgi:polyisoprenoid-binding protein YceI